MKSKLLMRPQVFLAIIAGIVAVVSFSSAYAFADSRLSGSYKCSELCVPLDGSDEPKILTVKKGTAVDFASADGESHNIALEHSGVQHHDHSEYESGEIASDEAWRVVFKEDGSYTFRDKNDSGFKAHVIVYTEGADYKVR